VKCAPGFDYLGAVVMVRRRPPLDDSKRAGFLSARLNTVRDRERKAQPLRPLAHADAMAPFGRSSFYREMRRVGLKACGSLG
jgi:hypothetical protein